MPLNETHDPQLRSFIESANAADCDFPIRNLPLAVYRPAGSNVAPRVGAGIGDQVLDIAAVAPLLAAAARTAAQACAEPTMAPLMRLGAAHWSSLRLALSRLLRADSQHAEGVRPHLLPIAASANCCATVWPPRPRPTR